MPVITLSRGAHCGGEALAEQLAKRLGYTCVSREVLLAGARKYNIDTETLEQELSVTPSLWQRLTREHHRYLVFVQASLVQAALDDNLVYHGHAGQVFLEGIGHVLKVRLEAPMEMRIHHAMEALEIEHDSALALINRDDASRQRWIRFFYDKEWRDPALYDLTFNLANLSVDLVCDIIASTVTLSKLQPTAESTERLSDLSVECEVRAALAADDKLFDQRLTVSAARGVVTVRGQVKNAEQRALLEDLVPKVKGVTSCRFHVGLVSDPLPQG